MSGHGGGIAGLRPNEVPSILERGEEVLTAKDPRHANNGGKGKSAPATQPMSIKIVNTIDSAEVISEGLSTSDGERALINVFRTNKSTFKAILG